MKELCETIWFDTCGPLKVGFRSVPMAIPGAENPSYTFLNICNDILDIK